MKEKQAGTFWPRDMIHCPFCGKVHVGVTEHNEHVAGCREKHKGKRASLREHWIRSHLPVMALDYMKTHSYEDCAKKSLELIDACLDAVCKGGDDGTPQT